MPIYEYMCKRCGNISECIQKVTDSPATDCSECGRQGSLEKIMSLGAFHLKGSGWYLTDYSRKDTPKASKKSEPPKESPKEKSKSEEPKDST